jgi:hypothetical protein
LSASNDPRHQQLETLQQSLATRTSVLHFAHAAVSATLTIMVGGSFRRITEDGPLWLAVGMVGMGAVTFGLALYTVIRGVMGRQALKVERARFEELQQLRRALNLETSTALLPR